jgi:hypothetical protein|eukprot:SAG25_NODE_2080_length_1977_cov_1.718850_2_plen_135_part_00
MAQSEAEFEAATRSLFARLDRDSSGHLDPGEVASAMKAVGSPCTPADVQVWWRQVDTDQSGRVSYDEFLAFRRERRAAVERVFGELCAHGEGSGLQQLSSATLLAGLRKLGLRATEDEVRAKVACLGAASVASL